MSAYINLSIINFIEIISRIKEKAPYHLDEAFSPTAIKPMTAPVE